MTDRGEPFDFADILNLRQSGNAVWEGPPGPGVGDRLFGGHALAQALMAASLAEDADRLAHSLHANFLNLGHAEEVTRYEVTELAEGRSFARRRVDAYQGKRAILTMTVSLQMEESGLEHSDGLPDVDDVHTARARLEAWKAQQEDFDALPILGRLWERPVETVPLDVQSLFGSAPLAPRSGCWMRAREKQPSNPAMARAGMAYASDMLFLRNSLLPHSVRPGDRRMQVASLDHAMWFHATPEFSNWHLYATESPWAGSARGLNQGKFFAADGTLVASVAQENLMRDLRGGRGA